MAFFMDRYDAQVYALLRMVVGFLFLWHGMQVLFGFPGGVPDGVLPMVIYIAGPIELVGGILVMIGFMTRQVAFLCSGLMAAAYWIAHASKALLPIMNQGELAVLFCFAFLLFSAHGSGIWSFDAIRSRS